MTASITIETSTLKDVREMRHGIRHEDALECLRLGLEPHIAVYRSYKSACVRRSAFVNGKLAAMYGVVGTPLSLTGHPYFITTYEATKVSPIAFARLYRKEVEELSQLFPVLENYVDATYLGAVKLLKIAGFTVDEQNPILTNHGDMFYKYKLESSN